MSDVKCPYCNTEQEINHDDGYGFEESCAHEQSCTSCGKTFLFYTSVTFTYDVSCKDGEHILKPSEHFPEILECTRCDHFERAKAQENAE